MTDTDDITDAELVKLFANRRIDRDHRDFYRGWLKHELRFNRCDDCGHWHHPPRPMCPKCWSWDITATPVAGDGRVHLLMQLHQGPPAPGIDYSTGTYPVVTVEFDDQPGVRYTSTVVGCPPEQITLDMPVTLTWIERDGAPLPVFEPAR